MKIKCPVGCGEYDATIINCHSELENHIKTCHDPGIKYARLLTKIHEKIEQWTPNDHMLYPYGYDNVVKVLKSLLE